MEDAHYHRVSAKTKYYEKKYDVYPNSGMDFKAALLEDVESHFNITSFWHGGDVPNAFEDYGISLADTVSVSSSFVVLAVQGKIPRKDLDKEGWGFSRTIPKKMRYWETNKEGEVDEKGESSKEAEGSKKAEGDKKGTSGKKGKGKK
ncbi:hypothetical protein F4859DRAFT_82289 [Xylaria cf. heliscus]|nr:hypothetical protein F4859DRAFT_82289 [Xylaria cf. heliscus]